MSFRNKSFIRNGRYLYGIRRKLKVMGYLNLLTIAMPNCLFRQNMAHFVSRTMTYYDGFRCRASRFRRSGSFSTAWTKPQNRVMSSGVCVFCHESDIYDLARHDTHIRTHAHTHVRTYTPTHARRDTSHSHARMYSSTHAHTL